ncbi:MAG: hypothetical protein LBE47_00575 [Methanomassiliicoccaceae archaeon]|jgi:hypothetical protein|nr:hypothetical protein [Methanomassiliicoccaceae archaeon]
MSYCTRCGADIEGNDHCTSCGTAVSNVSYKPKKNDYKVVTAVVAVVIILLVAGAGYFFLASERNTAQVTVNVFSTQSTPIDVTVNIGGEQKLSNIRLEPGGQIQETYSIRLPMSSSFDFKVITATSSGGTGSSTDYAFLFIERGGKYSVYLYV